jgi:processive 1,2-diacylglycerol beta-glucosyltransferase
MVNATLVTDFGVHSQWINPKAQLFLVAAPEVKEFLKTVKGIPEERIKVTGIPIRNVFTKTVDVAAARKKFNLKYDFTVLLMTNGQEIPDVEAICTKLLDLPVHIVVLCGKNEKMTEMATKLSANTDKIIIFGMAKDMDELMRVSDVLISKAGGITVSEATACALPIIMFRPYPGQEIYNRDYLINHNAGFLANKPKDVYEQVKSICENRERLTDMKKNSRSVGRPEAAQAVCQAVLEEYKSRYKV